MLWPQLRRYLYTSDTEPGHNIGYVPMEDYVIMCVGPDGEKYSAFYFELLFEDQNGVPMPTQFAFQLQGSDEPYTAPAEETTNLPVEIYAKVA